MKIIHIETEQLIKLTSEEAAEQEKNGSFFHYPFKTVKRKEPIYIVELSAKELQLISFYLELENRKPIVNVKLNTELTRKKGR